MSACSRILAWHAGGVLCSGWQVQKKYNAYMCYPPKVCLHIKHPSEYRIGVQLLMSARNFLQKGRQFYQSRIEEELHVVKTNARPSQFKFMQALTGICSLCSQGFVPVGNQRLRKVYCGRTNVARAMGLPPIGAWRSYRGRRRNDLPATEAEAALLPEAAHAEPLPASVPASSQDARSPGGECSSLKKASFKPSFLMRAYSICCMFPPVSMTITL